MVDEREFSPEEEAVRDRGRERVRADAQVEQAQVHERCEEVEDWEGWPGLEVRALEDSRVDTQGDAQGRLPWWAWTPHQEEVTRMIMIWVKIRWLFWKDVNMQLSIWSLTLYWHSVQCVVTWSLAIEVLLRIKVKVKILDQTKVTMGDSWSKLRKMSTADPATTTKAQDTLQSRNHLDHLHPIKIHLAS